MDFKNVLEEWKNYQQHKLVMANFFPCEAAFPRVNLVGNLSFRGSGAQRRLFLENPEGDGCSEVLLSEILGTAPQGSEIRFNRRNGTFFVVRFPSERTQRAAHEAFLRFEREEFGPTPPSRNSSEGSD